MSVSFQEHAAALAQIKHCNVQVLARPSLDSLNSVNSRVTIPAPEFSPTLLPSDRVGRLAKPCAGLCPVATQPGPDATASSDPSAHMFITFNHPIKPGPCFTGEYEY